MLKLVLQIFGIALVLVGGLWTLQGSGLLSWPQESFMLGQGEWAIYGLIALAAGLVLLWLARRSSRRPPPRR
ncbi:hypothetical protein RM533_04780 [Croceicoccus sp. F390]|uniref:Uncharacterized protein n=1 Tax=Croceicoccus esteveae TaxID=3075597 RepID=A0ABU2ZJA4_9SPHN|nr:hypothetical protein [Croceicoccus sp. F390]MDT0575492.1 hypothetical protein [Croceicoccus sp. F390]